MKKAAMVLCVLFALGSVSMGCAKSKEDQMKSFCADMLKASGQTDCKVMAKDMEKLKQKSKELEKIMGDKDAMTNDPKLVEAMAQCMAAGLALMANPCAADEAVVKAMEGM